MTEERPSDEEITAIVVETEAAGLPTIGVDAEGTETWALTPMSAQVANWMAMGAMQRPSRSGAQLTAISPATMTPWRPNCLSSSAA